MFCNENDRPYTLRADLVAARGDGSGGNRVPSRSMPSASTTSGMPVHARGWRATEARFIREVRVKAWEWDVGHGRPMPLRLADGGIWMPNSWPSS